MVLFSEQCHIKSAAKLRESSNCQVLFSRFPGDTTTTTTTYRKIESQYNNKKTSYPHQWKCKQSGFRSQFTARLSGKAYKFLLKLQKLQSRVTGFSIGFCEEFFLSCIPIRAYAFSWFIRRIFFLLLVFFFSGKSNHKIFCRTDKSFVTKI